MHRHPVSKLHRRLSIALACSAGLGIGGLGCSDAPKGVWDNSGNADPAGTTGGGATAGADGGSKEPGTGGDAGAVGSDAAPGTDGSTSKPPETTSCGGQPVGRTIDPTPKPFSPSGTLSMSSGHPRLWWTPARIAHAKQWAAQTHFKPSTTDTPQPKDRLDQALMCIIGGDDASAQAAVDFLMGLSLATDSPGDDARWYGEAAMLAYDWCHDRLTPSQIATLVPRWNSFIAAFDAKAWGGVGMESSNYYWGFFRNDFEWAAGSEGDNPNMQTALNDALVTRWRNSFIPFANTTERGGAALEGTEYGAYQLGYATVPLVTAELSGRPLMDETSFYKEAVFYVIYATQPGQSAHNGHSGWDMFPHADDESWLNGGSAQDEGYGNFMTAASMHWQNTAVGQYARHWLNTVQPSSSSYVKAIDVGGPEKDFSSLPLDYYAPGAGWLYTRNKWGADATSIWLKADSPGEAHSHQDFGSFQIWRKGSWLSRESVAYTESVAGWGGQGSVPANLGAAHNTLAYDSVGFATGTPVGSPKVLRMEHRADYSYYAVDISGRFRTTETDRPDRDNKSAGATIREFLFIKPMETMLVFDRVTSTGELRPADQVTKSFLVHFEQRPTITGNMVVGVSGDQALAMTTLVPASPTYRIVNEGGAIGQQRVELDTSGAATSYFLNVLQARDASAANVRATVQDNGNGYTVTVVHPTAGTATIQLAKGASSSGGSFSLTPSSCGVQPLTTTVEKTMVTDDGPVWGD